MSDEKLITTEDWLKELEKVAAASQPRNCPWTKTEEAMLRKGYNTMTRTELTILVNRYNKQHEQRLRTKDSVSQKIQRMGLV